MTDANSGAITDANDWRVTVQLHDAGQAGRAARALSTHQVEDQVHQRLGGKVAVGSGDDDALFLYTHTQDAAATARASVGELLAADGIKADFTIERWHPVAEEWEAADMALPDSAADLQAERAELDVQETADSLAAGYALFEVRVQLPSHHAAAALADRLQAEGYSVVRRWRWLVVGANNADQAEQFAEAVRGEAPAGSLITTEEVGPQRPYTVFELAAGSGL